MRATSVILAVLLLCLVGLAPAGADPVGTQVFTAPTAQTLREGDLRVSNTLPILTQFNYGLTDNLQLGVQTVYLVWTGVDLKYRFFETERVEAAVLAGGGLFMINARTHSLYARPVVSFRLPGRKDAEDNIRLHLGGSAVYNSTQDGAGFIGNGFVGAEVPLGTSVKLMAEFNYVYDPATTFPGNVPSWSAGTVGARFYGERAAVDAGLFIPFTDELLPFDSLGLPLLSFSYLF